MYEIRGKYNTASWEVLDEVDNKKEAKRLAAEYRLAFGAMWIIKTVKIK